jgi:hypothetical protein
MQAEQDADAAACYAAYLARRAVQDAVNTFNDFLATDDARLNREQADPFLAELRHYGVTIRTEDDLWSFRDSHPELFCPPQPDDEANGFQSLRTWWRWFRWWKQRLTPYDGPPLRRLGRARPLRLW